MNLLTRNIAVFLYIIISVMYAPLAFAQKNSLQSYVYIGTFSKDYAKMTFQKTPALNKLEAKYTLNLYKIRYLTPAPNGKMTVASGLVAMPASPADKVSIVSYMHGTRVFRSDVPSNNDVKNYIYPALFGSYGGYMLVMPDYLGMGDSELLLHPYVDAETLASSSIDMITASKELAQILHYPVNDKLFLAGYSEGGFTTMVTYEALLKNHRELPVAAVAPGSAPYDWDETIHFITYEPGPRATSYLAFFFYSMQTYNHYWSGLDGIFKKPYNTLVPVLFDGTHQAPEIMQALPTDPQLIFQDGFIESIMNGTDPSVETMKMNMNHYDFTSTSPLLLVGTKGDHDVPYHGSEIAYEVLKKKSNNVHIKSVSDVLDHIEAGPYVMKEQLEFFQKY